MHHFVSMFKTKTFKYALAAGLFIASALIVLAMLLGNQAGQFVIRVQDADVKRSIAITDEDITGMSYDDIVKVSGENLTAAGMDNMKDYSPRHFLSVDSDGEYQQLNEICSTMGESSVDSNSLFVYTFYVINTSQDESTVDVDVSMNFSSCTQDLDKIVRVMVYYQIEGRFEQPKIYQLYDYSDDSRDTDKIITVDYDEYIVAPNYFKSSNGKSGVVFDEEKQLSLGTRTKGNYYAKYSVMFWLEGNDPDNQYETLEESQKFYGASIKFSLDMSIAM